MSDTQIYSASKLVLDGIRERVGPNVPIYAVAMSPYDFYTTCYQRGVATIAPLTLQEVVTKMVTKHLVSAGHHLSLLYRNHLDKKSCLQNAKGQALDAQALISGFGK